MLNPHDGQLTFLGHVMAELPIDVRLGKLILLGHVFGLLEACMIISKFPTSVGRYGSDDFLTAACSHRIGRVEVGSL